MAANAIASTMSGPLPIAPSVVPRLLARRRSRRRGRPAARAPGERPASARCDRRSASSEHDTPIATGVATSQDAVEFDVERIERSPEQSEKDHRAEGDRGPAQLHGAAFAQPERAQQAARQLA
jgi:hypothetical protein